MSVTRTIPFEQSSVKETCPDCDKGHCSCYYTNQNFCCRCNRYQYDRILIERAIPWDEGYLRIMKREEQNKKRKSGYIFEFQNIG